MRSELEIQENYLIFQLRQKGKNSYHYEIIEQTKLKIELLKTN
jgi:hypothetical protein